MVDLNPVIDIGDGYCSVAVCNEGMVVCYTCIGCMFPKIAESFGFENICLVLVFPFISLGVSNSEACHGRCYFCIEL